MTIYCDGRLATRDDLAALALTNDGHFTSMQVRARAARGLDLHLQRLRAGTKELFALPLDDERVLATIRAAFDAEGVADASLRVTVFPRGYDMAHPDRVEAVAVLVSLAPPRDAIAKPAWVKTVRFQRTLPQVKHVGTFPLLQARRQARREGFDDALFVDAGGRISEGSLWNIGFWDGAQVVWPQAAALRGTEERLLQAGLAEAGVAQRHLPLEVRSLAGLKAAFATNATGIWPISGIDETELRPAPVLMTLLAKARATHRWQPLA